MRRNKKRLILMSGEKPAKVCIILLFSVLLFSGCDLFDARLDDDVARKIDDAVAWANAERLGNVQVNFPEFWGRSQQYGTLTADNTRKGFPFTVSFTPNAGYRLHRWIALEPPAGEPDFGATDWIVSIAEPAVIIRETGGGGAEVTVNRGGGVLLIPWCVGADTPTPEGAIPIRTQADLDGIRNNLTGNYTLVNSIALSGEWTPIGTAAGSGNNYTYEDAFKGKFYGNGFTISGLSLKDVPFAGLFGATQNAEIRDLTVVQNTGITTEKETMWIGGVVGNAGNGTVFRNIQAKGSLSVSSSGSGPLQVGGFVGYANDGASFTNCSVVADLVSAKKTAEVGGNIYIGGFAGNVYKAIFTNCYAAVPVLIPDDHIGNENIYICAGGFLGNMVAGSHLSTCHALKEVTVGAAKGRCFAGGLVGYSSGTNYDRCTISKCYAEGNVSAVVTITTAIEINVGVGGLTSIGSFLDITDCYALGTVTLTRKGSSTNGNAYAGGLVGRTVKNSFSAGSVDARRDNTGPLYAGGLIGQVEAGGNLSNSAAFGIYVGALGNSPTPYAGRITGQNSGALSNNYAYSGMRVETGAYTAPPNPYTPPTGGSPIGSSTGPDTIHGANAATSDFRSAELWCYKLFFNPSVWNFYNVDSTGYPVLVDLP